MRIPESVAGKPHVIGVLPEALEVAKAAEDSDCLLLRCASEDEVIPFFSRPIHAMQQHKLPSFH